MTELDASLRLRLVDEVTATARRIADQFHVVGAEAKSGVDLASHVFEDLRVRQLGAAEEARRLSAELRRMSASGQVSEGTLREMSVELVRAREEARQLGAAARDVTRAQEQMGRGAASGAPRAARAVDALSASTEALGEVTEEAAQSGLFQRVAMSFVSREAKNGGRELGGLVNTVAELGFSLGTAIPGMQQAGTQMAMMGGSAYQLGAGFGYWGVTAGVALGLLPLIISALNDTQEETDDTAEAFERMRDAAKESEEGIRELTDALRVQRRESAIGKGGGTGEQLSESLDDANARLERARAVEEQRERAVERAQRTLTQLEREQAARRQELQRMTVAQAAGEMRSMQEALREAQEAVTGAESQLEGARQRVARFETAAIEVAQRTVNTRAREIEEDRVAELDDEQFGDGFDRRESRRHRRSMRDFDRFLGSGSGGGAPRPRPVMERAREAFQPRPEPPAGVSDESLRLLREIRDGITSPRSNRVRVEVAAAEGLRTRVSGADDFDVDTISAPLLGGQQ